MVQIALDTYSSLSLPLLTNLNNHSYDFYKDDRYYTILAKKQPKLVCKIIREEVQNGTLFAEKFGPNDILLLLVVLLEGPAIQNC